MNGPQIFSLIFLYPLRLKAGCDVTDLRNGTFTIKLLHIEVGRAESYNTLFRIITFIFINIQIL